MERRVPHCLLFLALVLLCATFAHAEEGTETTTSLLESSAGSNAHLHTDVAVEQAAETGVGADGGGPEPDYDSIDPTLPSKSPHFFKPAHIDIEPIAGGVVRLDLNHLEAAAACFCQLPERIRKLQNSQCLIPHRITVYKPVTHKDTTDSVASELPVDTLRALVGSINDVRLASASQASFACVDGRQVHLDAPRTWGGDFGEIIQAMSFISSRSHSPLKQDAVDSFFFSWLDNVNGRGAHESMMYSTDVDAIVKLSQWIKDKYNIAGRQLIDLTNVPPYMQDIVLEGMKHPANVGSLPIRMMLEFPERFKINPEVVHMAHEAFFKLFWRKDVFGVDGPMSNRLKLIISEGMHNEKAFLSIRGSADCENEGIFPVLVTSPDVRLHGDPLPPRAGPAETAPGSDREREAAEQAQRDRLKRQEAVNAQSAGKFQGSFLEVDAAVSASAAATAATTTAAKSAAEAEIKTTAKAAGAAEVASAADADGAAVGLNAGLWGSAALDPADEFTVVSRDTTGAHSRDTTGAHIAAGSSLAETDSSLDADAAAAAAAQALVEAEAKTRTQAGAQASVSSSAATAAAGAAASAESAASEEAVPGSSAQVRSLQDAKKKRDAEAEKARIKAMEQEKTREKPILWPSRTDDTARKAGGMWAPGTRYRPQTGLQVYMFNQNAALSLRKEILFKLLQKHRLGGDRGNTWAEYAMHTVGNDRIFTEAIAGHLPQYVLYMQ